MAYLLTVTSQCSFLPLVWRIAQGFKIPSLSATKYDHEIEFNHTTHCASFPIRKQFVQLSAFPPLCVLCSKYGRVAWIEHGVTPESA
ncbi:hypothetical protein DFJ43DRAFT_1053266 [Lentinula guzmanii]|uniref:Uncharacterized protein n=1 Tax=Lentinula guzmanii TaxID=2804957 RepID=A0AA38JJ28_9AGAR|nr:hypothetical protein DFJ43DRAFT_1053266 [Lentinula guzmanii]